jgi:hypothetical protein
MNFGRSQGILHPIKPTGRIPAARSEGHRLLPQFASFNINLELSNAENHLLVQDIEFAATQDRKNPEVIQQPCRKMEVLTRISSQSGE